MRLSPPLAATLVALVLVAPSAAFTAACGDSSQVPAPPPGCVLAPGARADYLARLGCAADFDALASAPLGASIPGARSVKTVIDRLAADDAALYFQDTITYRIHWEFARRFLSGGGRPPVPDRASFNRTEYYSPARRLVLGALTRYDEPGVWVYEVAPYDTADAAMISAAFRAVRAACWCGDTLRFHPTSAAVERVAAALSADVPVLTTRELFAEIRYQPLNLATAMGRLRFAAAADVVAGTLDFRDIVVLDHVPNDIAVVSGIITSELQTPLSHLNVLSQNRGTPNMGLVGAQDDPTLVALEGRWVELVVGAQAWSIRAVDEATATAWWEAHKPTPLAIPAPDLSVVDVREIGLVLDVEGAGGLGPALAQAIPAFGGKASHYAALTRIGPAVPVAPALAVPGSWYHEHLAAHGLDAQIAAMLADPEFIARAEVRGARLAALRAAIAAAPVDPARLAALEARLDATFGGSRLRFRSSTNAEDLDGFTGAGLYTSAAGAIGDPDRTVADALRTVWASTWNFKAFEERSYRSIDPRAVVMAVLVHRAFAEDANGVAITANLFDASGLEPGFVVNAQKGEASVVRPDPGITTDYFLYFFHYPNQPAVYLSHSNLISEGATVLSIPQAFRLGQALDAIHQAFYPVYGGRPGAFYGMDVEFKFVAAPGAAPALWIKQARPHPGWGLVLE